MGITLFWNPVATLRPLSNQTHTSIPPPHPHLTHPILHPIAEACPSQTLSQPCVYVHPLNCSMPQAPSKTPCPNHSHKSTPSPVRHPETGQQLTPCTNCLSTTSPATRIQRESNVKQNTKCTTTCSSVTFHSLTYLHASNLREQTTNMHSKQTWAYNGARGVGLTYGLLGHSGAYLFRALCCLLPVHTCLSPEFLQRLTVLRMHPTTPHSFPKGTKNNPRKSRTKTRQNVLKKPRCVLETP